MSVLNLLNVLEDVVENSSVIPFSGRVLVDKDEIMELIKEIRIQLPDEVKQAQWIKEERNKILIDAQEESENLIQEAKNRIEELADHDEVVKIARKKAEEIINESEERAKEIQLGSIEYADEILGNIEKSISSVLETIYKNREELKNIK